MGALTTSLPCFLLGFPNFGHLIEELPRRVETLSSVAIPACVTQFDNQPWDGHCRPAPQMLLVADVGEDGLVDTGMSAMQEDISRRLFHPRSEEGDTLGGFSGGPVAASCWDDCLVAFGRSMAGKRLIPILSNQ